MCHQSMFTRDSVSNLPFVLKVFAKARNTPLSTGELDQVVAQFAGTICNSQPVFVQNPAASKNMYYHLIEEYDGAVSEFVDE